MTKEQLLAEVDDLLRTMPPRQTIRHETEENLSWMGKVAAVIEQWSPPKATLFRQYLDQFQSIMAHEAFEAFRKILILLHQARHDLQMQIIGPLNIVVSHGMVFDYFDEIRKIIEMAKQDLFFIDPYLDAEFVSRYMGHITPGVTTRLLAREKLLTLLPAVDIFVQQRKEKVEVRSEQNFHDRYLFVDRIVCYQSGASFKDGAKKAPTILTQITDAFIAMLQTYEDIWNRAKVER
jgi:hypothetical protein